ncbi:ROK family transcriptional regulator [Priestia flexa]|uniref:ROK family transcriptional regulator n=1 Tax=Priestia flexa TaxID=86664 RepID=UPI0024C07F4F|nr:ROK family transcriptional regulator [Priestia flexa]WHX80481.1 ROK family transcriptional regulator [Priestia flexa]
MVLKGQNTARTKQLNQSLVLRVLLQNGPMSRQKIAEITQLTPATITYITAELIQEGFIIERGDVQEGTKRVGRKSIALDLQGDAYWTVGVHISMETIRVGLVNLKGETRNIQVVPVPADFNLEEYLEFVARRISEYINAQEVDVASIGIGSLGAVDLKEGKLLGNDIIGWPDVPIVQYLKKKLKLPIYFDNNVSALTLAEKMFGQGKQVADFMCLYLGYRIGASLVLKSELYRSGLTGAGEFGHMTYLPDGKPCWCGSSGCLNQYASEQAIVEELQAQDIQEVLQRVANQEGKARRVVEKAAERIAVVLASFVNMVHLKKIVVSGPLTLAGVDLTSIIKQEVNERSFLARKEEVEVISSELGEYVEIIGAGSLALWYSVYQKQV